VKKTYFSSQFTRKWRSSLFLKILSDEAGYNNKLSFKKYSMAGAYIEYDILKFSMHEYSIFAQIE